MTAGAVLLLNFIGSLLIIIGPLLMFRYIPADWGNIRAQAAGWLRISGVRAGLACLVGGLIFILRLSTMTYFPATMAKGMFYACFLGIPFVFSGGLMLMLALCRSESAPSPRLVCGIVCLLIGAVIMVVEMLPPLLT